MLGVICRGENISVLCCTNSRISSPSLESCDDKTPAIIIKPTFL